MNFDYFYNRQAERFSFYMLPKILLSDEHFKSLSSDAKIFYACLLERTSYSYKNNWIDAEDRVYIIFTIDEIMETLSVSNKTASKISSELENIGLIEKKRQGLGKPNIIYVKDFMSVFDIEKNEYITRSVNSTLQKCNNYTSRNVKSTSQEVKKVHGIDTNYNNTNYNNIKGGEKKIYGQYQNVFLNESEYQELLKELGDRLNEYIERLSTYMKSNNRTYEDHKATIINWYLNDNKYKSKTQIKTFSKDFAERKYPDNYLTEKYTDNWRQKMEVDR